MQDLSKQIEVISKQLMMDKPKDIDPVELDSLEKEFQSDVKDLAVLQKVPLKTTPVVQPGIFSTLGPLHLEIPPPPLLSPPPFPQKVPVLCADQNVAKTSPKITHILAIPKFWKKFDLDEIIEISRENAQSLASDKADIGERLLRDFEETAKSLKFLYEAIQDGLWNSELEYLNTKTEKKNLKPSELSSKRKRKQLKSRLCELHQMRSDRVQQKIDVLETIANTPFELQEILTGTPMDEIENMY